MIRLREIFVKLFGGILNIFCRFCAKARRSIPTRGVCTSTAANFTNVGVAKGHFPWGGKGQPEAKEKPTDGASVLPFLWSLIRYEIN